MANERRTREEYDCICLTCGNITPSFVLTDGKDGGAIGLGKCKKCSKKSYPMTLVGNMWLVNALVKQNVQMKAQIFDLEAAIEEMIDPIGGEP